MSVSKYKINIKSPNDKIGCETVECEVKWRIKDLKAYLSENYSTRPPPSSQRLIHAGRLLKDDLPISSLFPKEEEVQTIHLVCPISKTMLPKSEVKQERKETDIQPEDIEKYQEAYYQYLQEFYMNTNHSGRPVQTLASQAWWPYCTNPGAWPQPTPWMNPMQYPGIPSNPSFNSTIASNTVPTDPNPNNSYQQLGEPFQQDVADPVPEQPAQPAMMVNNPMGNDMIRAEEFGEGGEIDLLDRFYMLFRFCLFVGLCFAYSSLDKAIIVFSVAAYVYLYNIYRRYAAVNRVAQPTETPNTPNTEETIPDHPSDNSELSAQATDPDQEVRQRSSSPPTEQQNPPAQQSQHAPALSRWTTNLRIVASTSFQFISSLFTSLIPEQPPPIRLD